MSHDRFHRACGHLWGVRVGAFCLLLASPALAMAGDKAAGPKPPSAPQPASQAQVVAAYGKLPLSFEANQGQTDPRVRFLSRGRGYGLFLTSSGAVLVLQKPSAVTGKLSARRNSKSENRKSPALNLQSQIFNHQSSIDNSPAPSPQPLASRVLHLRLVGANASAKVTGLDELSGKSNYFIGSEPKKWRTNVPNYAKVAYKNVYPGVDLVYYGNQRQLEYDFVVAPGADPGAIRLEVVGAGLGDVAADLFRHTADGGVKPPLQIAANGDLVIATAAGGIGLDQPTNWPPNPRGKP